MKALVIAAAAFLGAVTAQAAVLDLTPSTTIPAVRGVAIAASGTAHVEGRDTALVTVGKGLRQKKKLLIMVDVYVAQVLSKPGVTIKGLTAAQSLDTLDKAGVFAIDMEFLRNVDAPTMVDAFKESLTANGVDLNSADLKSFLAAVIDAGDAATGKALRLVTERLADGTEAITWENTANGKTSTIHFATGSALGHQLISIWFGTIPSSDSGLVNLQTALLQGI